MARRRLIAGNWKMNTPKAPETMVDRIAMWRGASELLVCPPFPLIAALTGRGVAVGGQDCHGARSGAHTGDVAAEMLEAAGCSYVIVGHSERRSDHGEDNATVAAKCAAAQQAGLTAILCAGEELSERESGRALEIVEAELLGSLPEGCDPARLVVAYEPVWAIGSGLAATENDIREMHGMIRAALRGRFGGAAEDIRILYGGSMKPENAPGILVMEDVDGGLIGGASLTAESFLAIADAAG